MSTSYNDSHSPPHTNHGQVPYVTPPVTVTLTVILLVFFFGGIFSIYICRCFMAYLVDTSNMRNSGRLPSSNAVQPTGGGGGGATTNGLDASIVNAFPTFLYSSVKDLRLEKCSLECAVCLAEFEDEDELRLLTVCNHVFHPECIDLWFENHNTCPLCRRSLLPSDEKSSPPAFQNNNVVTVLSPPRPAENEQQENGTRDDNNSVSSKDDEEEEQEEERDEVVLVVVVDDKEESHGQDATSSAGAIGTENNRNVIQKQEGESRRCKKYPRWHSTGHSIINMKRDPNDKRYTLKLPDHVKEQLVRGHNWTGSCTTFGDLSNDDGDVTKV